MYELPRIKMPIPKGNESVVEIFQIDGGLISVCYEGEDHGRLGEIAKLLLPGIMAS